MSERELSAATAAASSAAPRDKPVALGHIAVYNGTAVVFSLVYVMCLPLGCLHHHHHHHRVNLVFQSKFFCVKTGDGGGLFLSLCQTNTF